MIQEDIQHKVLTHFVWKPDIELYGTFEDWRSHEDTVNKGQVFYDDCDGFAMTCAKMLLHAGVKPEEIMLAFCQTETNEAHLVCISEGFVLDNRSRSVWKMEEVPYNWVSGMKLSEPGIWRMFLEKE